MPRKVHPIPSLTALTCLVLAAPAGAQVTADGTLGTTVTPSGATTYTITGGQFQGSTTLLQSFGDFSLPNTTDTAHFDLGNASYGGAANGVNTVIGRVTGGNLSTINGQIRLTGGNAPDLFLINPSGIVFGAGASLNVPGSFVASTAERVLFENGVSFGTNGTTPNPLLTVSAPVGLQLGANPGQITVNNTGRDTPVPTTNLGLAPAAGRTLALVGGDVIFNGGVVTAPSGRIEIGSAANGQVSLTQTSGRWQLDYDGIQDFRDIQLLNRASLWNANLTANPQGGIQVQGGTVTVDASQIGASTLNADSGADITLNARQALTLTGEDLTTAPYGAWVFNSVGSGMSGAGGAIDITTPQLTLQSGALIQTLNQGSGAAGAITVTGANTVDISGASSLSSNPAFVSQDLTSRIASTTLSTGAGGAINLSTQNLRLQDGGQILTEARGATGPGGNVTVTATDTTVISGYNPASPGFTSGINSSTLSTGAGGAVQLTTGQLQIDQGGLIYSTTDIRSGTGGNIALNVTGALSVSGQHPLLATPSGVLSLTSGPGTSGTLTVDASQVDLSAGATITSFVRGEVSGISLPGAGTGQAGDVTVTARDRVNLTGVGINGSGAAISSATVGAGNAGNVSVSSPRVTIQGGAGISSGVSLGNSSGGGPLPGTGQGNGGNVVVRASEFVEVNGVSPVAVLSSSISTYTFGQGNAGTTQVVAPVVNVRNGAAINSATVATGNAGQILLETDALTVSGVATNGLRARVTANAEILDPVLQALYGLPAVPTGDTGELVINTQQLAVTDGGTITVQHEGIGDAGQLEINADSIFLSNQGSLTANTAFGGGGNLNLLARRGLVMRYGSLISAEAGGAGNGGNITINAPVIAGFENSDIIANAVQGNGGNINITTQGIFGLEFRPQLTPENDITASSQFGVNGTVEINEFSLDPDTGIVELPAGLADTSDQIAQGCATDGDSSFVATGRGGIPPSPNESLSSDLTWGDTRDLSEFLGSAPSGPAPTGSVPAQPPDLAEINAWRINANGQIELLAVNADAPASSAAYATCSAPTDLGA
jgi:filamentous hemagglutinin family protein